MSAVYGLANIHVKGFGEFDIHHFRKVTCQGTGETRVVTRANSRLPNYSVHPHGGYTEAELRLKDGRVYKATARCSAEDNFSYREGANQAAARVLQQYGFDNLPKKEITTLTTWAQVAVGYLIPVTSELLDFSRMIISFQSWNSDGGVVVDSTSGRSILATAPLIAWRTDQVVARLSQLSTPYDKEFFCPVDRAVRYRKTGELPA